MPWATGVYKHMCPHQHWACLRMHYLSFSYWVHWSLTSEIFGKAKVNLAFQLRHGLYEIQRPSGRWEWKLSLCLCIGVSRWQHRVDGNKTYRGGYHVQNPMPYHGQALCSSTTSLLNKRFKLCWENSSRNLSSFAEKWLKWMSWWWGLSCLTFVGERLSEKLRKFWLQFGHFFIFSFIHQVLFEGILCAQYRSRHWADSSKQRSPLSSRSLPPGGRKQMLTCWICALPAGDEQRGENRASEGAGNAGWVGCCLRHGIREGLSGNRLSRNLNESREQGMGLYHWERRVWKSWGGSVPGIGGVPGRPLGLVWSEREGWRWGHWASRGQIPRTGLLSQWGLRHLFWGSEQSSDAISLRILLLRIVLRIDCRTTESETRRPVRGVLHSFRWLRWGWFG